MNTNLSPSERKQRPCRHRRVEAAREIAYEALDRSPNDHGIRVFVALGRTPSIGSVIGRVRYANRFSTGGDTFIHVASLSTYYGDYLFKAGTYVTRSSSGTSVSVNGQVRHYFGGARTYASVSGSAGASASDPMFERTCAVAPPGASPPAASFPSTTARWLAGPSGTKWKNSAPVPFDASASACR